MAASANQKSKPFELEVFFDGACPLCRREIGLLRRVDRKHRIRFTNIAAEDFKPGDYGLTMETFMSEMHGRLPDGTWLRGIEVFRVLYSAIGLNLIVRVTRLPVISGFLEWGYRIFARNRLRWTGRCSSARCPSTNQTLSTMKPECDRV